LKWYWQVYCGLIFVLGYGQMLRKILTDTGGFSSRYLAAIIVTLIIVMLVAQSKDKALGRSWFWQTLFIILALTAITSLLFAIYLAINSVWISTGLLLTAAVALTPALVQLYSYGFKSQSLWEQ